MSELTVITMDAGDRSAGYMTQLLDSCERHGLGPITILGTREAWVCHMQKVRLLATHFRERPHKPRDIIVWVDAYDTVFQGGERELRAAFDRYGKPMLFSAEQGPGWPLPAHVFPPTPHAYRGICAGVWMAEVWAVRQMLDLFDPYHLPDEYPGDDQGLIQAYAFLKPGLCAIDHECRLAQTLGLAEPNHLDYRRPDRVANTLTDTIPCVLHGAAGYDMTAIMTHLRHDPGTPPAPRPAAPGAIQ